MKKVLSALLLVSSMMSVTAHADILQSPLTVYLEIPLITPSENCYEGSCVPSSIRSPGTNYRLEQVSRTVKSGSAIYLLKSVERTDAYKGDYEPIADQSVQIKIEVPLDLLGMPDYRHHNSHWFYIDLKFQINNEKPFTKECLRNTYHRDTISCYVTVKDQSAEVELYIADK